jgi:hypothetical protein
MAFRDRREKGLDHKFYRAENGMEFYNSFQLVAEESPEALSS